MKFGYFINLKEGYRPVMELEEITDLEIVIEAENRVTADRMIGALLHNCDNVADYIGICIED